MALPLVSRPRFSASAPASTFSTHPSTPAMNSGESSQATSPATSDNCCDSPQSPSGENGPLSEQCDRRTTIPKRRLPSGVHAPQNNVSLDDHGGEEHCHEQQPTVPATILHRIASYLSLSDAESMASLTHRSPPTIDLATNPDFLPGYHSLDHHFYCPGAILSPSDASVRQRHDAIETETNTRFRQNLRHPIMCQFQQSLSSLIDSEQERNECEDWSQGKKCALPCNSSLGCGASSPLTPGLIALSPLEEEWDGEYDHNGVVLEETQSSKIEHDTNQTPWTPAGQATSENEQEACITNVSSNEIEPDTIPNEDESFFAKREQRQKKQALQRRLAAAVFAHPYPLRDYCLDAYATALKLSMKRQTKSDSLPKRNQELEDPPETMRDRPLPSSALRDPETSPEPGAQTLKRDNIESWQKQKQHQRYQQLRLSRAELLRVLMSKLFHSVPLSILLDLLESAFDLSIDTFLAVGRISVFSTKTLISVLCAAIRSIIDLLSSINPCYVFEIILNAQRSAVGKTGEVLASGIQSVATGVRSASSAALNRLSRQGLAFASGIVGGGAPGVSRTGGAASADFGRIRKDSAIGDNCLDSKLFRRLHRMESVSKLIAYTEKTNEALGQHAKKRAQRMMHYNVSFRPFTATILTPGPKMNRPSRHGNIKPSVSFELAGSRARSGSSMAESEWGNDCDDDSFSSSSLQSTPGSMFMHTPTSFPPTPTSRLYYFEKGSRFTENVIFLARDQLRVEDGLCSRNEQTRAMSKALREGSRLAVFNAADAAGGIALSCGQHIATKVGNTLYCSTRSMIPVMRNSFVYFEMSVSPPPPNMSSNIYHLHVDVAILSIGLSTLEMPLNTLVGAWKGSVGLCTTGQVLLAGQWYSPADAQDCSYGSNSTVGCLIHLDDRSSFDTQEGVMVPASVTLNVNGVVIPTVVISGPSVAGSRPPPVNPPEPLQGDESAATLTLIVPRSHELFPTVTLHSPATCVMCRFSAEDILATTREEIGAPNGATVYSIDGSVLLDQSSNSVDLSDQFMRGTRSEFCGDDHVESSI